MKFSSSSSLIHLMCAIAHAHGSTRATSLMRVRNSMRGFFFMTLVVWDFGMKKIKGQKHQIEKLIIFP